MFRRLNPEYAEKQQQAQEIADLKAQVAELIALMKGREAREERPSKSK